MCFQFFLFSDLFVTLWLSDTIFGRKKGLFPYSFSCAFGVGVCLPHMRIAARHGCFSGEGSASVPYAAEQVSHYVPSHGCAEQHAYGVGGKVEPFAAAAVGKGGLHYFDKSSH